MKLLHRHRYSVQRRYGSKGRTRESAQSMKEESEDDHAAVYPSYEGCQEGGSSIPGTEKALVIQVTMIGYDGENECIDKTKESDYTMNGNIPFADPKYSEVSSDTTESDNNQDRKAVELNSAKIHHREDDNGSQKEVIVSVITRTGQKI